MTLCSSLTVQPHFIPPSTPRGRTNLPVNSKIEIWWLDHWWKHHALYGPLLCLRVQTTSDWGCCLSSCPLYKLIWPETFALLGAQRDVMLADTSWRPSPCWLQALWWSLVLYLVACSYPNITSQFFDRGKNSMRCENPETQLSAGLVLKELYLCMLGKDKAVFEVWI